MSNVEIAWAYAREVNKTHVADGRRGQTTMALSNAIFGYDAANARSYLMPSGRRSRSESKAIAAWLLAARGA